MAGPRACLRCRPSSWNAVGAANLLLARMARHGIIAGHRQPPPAPSAVPIDRRLSSRRHHRRSARETSRNDLSITAADRGHDDDAWAFLVDWRFVRLKKT